MSEKRIIKLRELNADPAFRELRATGIRYGNKRRWSKSNARQAFSDKIRGFHVPPDMAADYRHLTRIKHIPAREAARILGLIACHESGPLWSPVDIVSGG